MIEYTIVCSADTYTGIVVVPLDPPARGASSLILQRRFRSYADAHEWVLRKATEHQSELVEVDLSKPLPVVWAEATDGLPYGSEAL